MNSGDHVHVEVLCQGSPMVNHAIVTEMDSRLALVEIDMRSKRCEAWGFGDTGSIWIMPTEDALHLDESKPRNLHTEILFPQFTGWKPTMTDSGRYTIRVLMRKVQP